MASDTVDRAWIVYKITCLINGKIYVGMTSKIFRRRWDCHLADAKMKRYRSPLHAAIRKYGKSAFSCEIIGHYSSRDLASAAEIEGIAKFNSKIPFGYNIAEGGFGGSATRGRKRSKETIEKISKALTGRKMDPEVVERIAQKLRGRKLPEWHAAIIRVAGRKNKGKVHTLQQRLDNRLRKRLDFLQRSLNGNHPGCFKSGARWRVRIMRNGKRLDLGSFDTLEEAKYTYIAATKDHIESLEAGAPRKYEMPDTSTRRSTAMKLNWEKRNHQNAVPSAKQAASQPQPPPQPPLGAPTP